MSFDLDASRSIPKDSSSDGLWFDVADLTANLDKQYQWAEQREQSDPRNVPVDGTGQRVKLVSSGVRDPREIRDRSSGNTHMPEDKPFGGNVDDSMGKGSESMFIDAIGRLENELRELRREQQERNEAEDRRREMEENERLVKQVIDERVNRIIGRMKSIADANDFMCRNRRTGVEWTADFSDCVCARLDWWDDTLPAEFSWKSPEYCQWHDSYDRLWLLWDHGQCYHLANLEPDAYACYKRDYEQHQAERAQQLAWAREYLPERYKRVLPKTPPKGIL